MAGTSATRLAAIGRTDVGRRRSENQDRFLIVGLEGDAPVRIGSEGSELPGAAVELDAAAGVALLVADGMGGRQGGERASQIVVDVVNRELTTETVEGDGEGGGGADAFASRLRASLCEANRTIHAEASSDGALRGMGTTATLAGIFDMHVYVAQVGDSRAYLIRGTEMLRLTRDQSLVQDMIDSGLLDEAEARTVPNNMLLQALGVRPEVRPAVTFHPLRDGDVLLLCSDGLTQVLDDEEIVAAVRAAPDLPSLCDVLVSTANGRGGPDNITAVVARVSGDGPEGSEAPEPLALRRWKHRRTVS